LDIKHNTEHGSFTVGIDDESVKLAASLGIDAAEEIKAALNKDVAEMRDQMAKAVNKDDRRVFYVDVSGMNDDEAKQHVGSLINEGYFIEKPSKKFLSTKTFGNDRGLSCCFRQWRSTHSHCSKVHGYSIGVKFIFECDTLDERNWVMDFGGLKPVKQWLEYMFDHTMVIAEDDPMLSFWQAMAENPDTAHSIDLRVVPGVGCERFAELVFDYVTKLLDDTRDQQLNPTVRLKSVEVFEHGANSAICERS
jgi:6-pyruvoyltetrahydropterin/6-carboxytetrahydropterin synthase